MAFISITEDVLSVIKAPPLKAPTISWSTDAVNTYNNVVNNIFQFSGRFVYDDYEKSVWGPISDVLIIDDHYTGLGTTTITFRTSNRISLVFEIPDDETLIDLDIGFRVGNYGAWYLFETVDITSYRGGNYTHYFYNDKVALALDQKDFARPFDYVPKLAGAQEIIGGADGAYITYGDITEGFDGIDSSSATFGTNYVDNAITGMSAGNITQTGKYTYTFAFAPVGDYGYGLTIVVDGNHWRFVYPYDKYWQESTGTVQTVVPATIGAYFISIINDSDAPVTASGGATVTLVFNSSHDEIDLSFMKAYKGSVVPTLKQGAKHYPAIVYKDKYGRKASVYKDDSFEFYVPSIPEGAVANPFNKRVQLSYAITHTPPDWAYTWQIVYGGNSLAWYQQFVVRSHDRADKSLFVDGKNIRLKINQGINDVRDEVSNFIYPNYIWRQGDRIRILGDALFNNVGAGFDNDDPFDKADEYYDEEIIGFDGIYIQIPSWDAYANLPDPLTEYYDFLVEIYHPKRDNENMIYYGIGRVYDITDPGTPARVHADDSGNIDINDAYMSDVPLAYLNRTGPYVESVGSETTTTTTTTSTVYPGDYITWRVGFRTAFIETQLQSVFLFNSNVRGIGEVYIINKDEKEVRLNNVRYSGIHIGKTFINQLNRFDYNDDISFDDKHGTLSALEEVGYTLKVLQRSKLTSLYIGREMSLDAEGNEVLVYSKNVLGSKHPSVEDYGTDQSAGVVVSSRYLYFPDISHGVIVRDSPNGQEEVSKYGMESYFSDLFKYLRGLDTSDYKIIAGVDRSKDMVYFTILDYDTPANTVTLAFDEKARQTQDGRYSPWKSFYSFSTSIEHYGSVGQKSFLTFLSGALWKHNSDSADRGKFHGAGASEQEIWLVSNINPQELKSWDTIEVASNKIWTIAEDDSIVIDASTRYPYGMQSKILSVDWEEYEEGFRAAFNFDMLSDGTAVASNYYLHNGRELRGRNMLIKLKNSETDEVNLILIKVNSKVSK